jgi:hypothetical protein
MYGGSARKEGGRKRRKEGGGGMRRKEEGGRRREEEGGGGRREDGGGRREEEGGRRLQHPPALSALPPGNVWHPAGVDIRRHAGLPTSRHVAPDLHRVVRHPQVRVDPVEAVLHLRVAVVQVLARSRRAVAGPNRLLDLLQLNAHVVDVSVDGDQVHVAVLLWPGAHRSVAIVPANLPLGPREGRVALE